MYRYFWIVLLAFVAYPAIVNGTDAGSPDGHVALIRQALSEGNIEGASRGLAAYRELNPNSSVESSVLQGEIHLARFHRDCHPWNVSAQGLAFSLLGSLDKSPPLRHSELAARQYRVRALGQAHRDLLAAHREFLSTEKKSPDDPEVVRGLGQTWYYLGQKQAAFKYLNRAVAAAPLDAKLLRLRGTARFTLGRLRSGIDDFRRAVRLRPDAPETRSRLIESYYVTNDFASAADHEQWFFDYQPQNLAELRICGIALLTIAIGNPQEEVSDRGQQLLKKLSTRFPDCWEISYLCAECDIHKERYEHAETGFSRALELFDGGVNPYRIYRYRAIARQEKKDWVGGLQDAEQAINLEPVAALSIEDYNRSLRNLGRTSEIAPGKRRFQAIVELYKLHRKLDLAPDDGELWTAQAKKLANLGWYDWALTSFDRAESLIPESAEPVTGKATLLFHLGNFRSAIAECNRSLQLEVTREAHSVRGDSWLALKEPEKALQDFKLAMRLDSAVADAWLLLTEQRLTAGDTQGANLAAKRLLEIAPERKPEVTALLDAAQRTN